MAIKFENKQETAARLGCSVRTVSVWMRAKKIPYLKLTARAVRFNPEEVDAALAKFTVRNREARVA